jgi:hypothetical protein
VDIDYESRQPIHTPAYHTSEQSTLQTPDSLCLDPHTTLANTYGDFRVTTYDLRLPSFLLGPTTTSSLSLSSISLSSQPTLTAISELRLTTYDLRLTTYDWTQLCFTGTHPPPAVSQFNISLRSQPTLTPLSEYPLRKQTSQHNTISLSSQPAKNLRRFLPSYDLQLTSSTGTHTHTHTHLLYQNIH